MLNCRNMSNCAKWYRIVQNFMSSCVELLSNYIKLCRIIWKYIYVELKRIFSIFFNYVELCWIIIEFYRIMSNSIELLSFYVELCRIFIELYQIMSNYNKIKINCIELNRIIPHFVEYQIISNYVEWLSNYIKLCKFISNYQKNKKMSN